MSTSAHQPRCSATNGESPAATGQPPKHDAAAPDCDVDTARHADARYQRLFEDSPLSLWDQDFSAVRSHLAGLQADPAVGDLRTHLLSHPSAIADCVHRVGLVAANRASMRLYGATTTDQLLGDLSQVVGEEGYPAFVESLLAVASGQTTWECETVNRTLSGQRLDILLHCSLTPGYEDSYGSVLVSITDITRLKRAEASLRESEEQFRSIFERSLDGIALTDESQRITHWNASLERITGLSSAAVLGRRAEDVFAPLNSAQRAEGILAALAAAGPERPGGPGRPSPSGQAVKTRLCAPEGLERVVQSSSFAIPVAGGHRVCTILHDITDQQFAEETLRESEARFRGIFQRAAIGIGLAEMTGRVVAANPAFEQMLGYTAAELSHMTFPEYTHPADLPFEGELYNEIVSGARDQYQIDKRYLRRDGSVMWAHLVVSLVRDGEGEPEYAICMVQDITEQKHAEEARRQTEARYGVLFEQMAQGVVYHNAQGKIIAANPAAQRILGMDSSALLGRDATDPIWQAVDDEGAPLPPRMHPALVALRRGATVQGVVMGVSAANDGRRRWLNVSAVPQFRQGEYRAQGVFSTFEDITERKQLEEAIARSRDFYLKLFDEFPAPVWRADELGQVDYFNKAWLALTGRSLEEELGDRWLADVHPDDVQRLVSLMSDRQLARQPFEIQVRLLDRSGEYRMMVYIGRPHYDLDGNYAGYIGFCYDVTERERAGEVIWLYAQRLRVLNEIGRAVLAGDLPSTIAQSTLQHLAKFVPCQAATVVLLDGDGKTQSVLAIESELPALTETGWHVRVSRAWYRALLSGEVAQVDDLEARQNRTVMARDLRALGIRSIISVPLMVQGKLLGALNCLSSQSRAYSREHVKISREIADQLAIALEHARLFEEVVTGRERLRQLAQQVVSAQEDERRRVSRELHDEAGQSLTALRLHLEIMQMDLPEEGLSALRESLAEAVALTDSTMTQIRQLAHDLRPSALDAVGLGPTLEDMCHGFARRANLSIVCDGLQFPLLPDATKIGLYRFAQECLTNVVRHACAHTVHVTAECTDDTITITVQDDGVGFDPATVALDAPRSGHLGLLGMRERLELLSGHLEIHSAPGTGTRLVASVPVRRLSVAGEGER